MAGCLILQGSVQSSLYSVVEGDLPAWGEDPGERCICYRALEARSQLKHLHFGTILVIASLGFLPISLDLHFLTMSLCFVELEALPSKHKQAGGASPSHSKM